MLTNAVPDGPEHIRWEHLNSSDVAKLHALMELLENADETLFRTSPDEVAQMLSRPTKAATVAAYDATDAAGDNPVAFAYVGLASSGVPEAICHGGVLPARRGTGVGQALVRWQTEVGSALVRDAFPDTGGRVVHVIDGRREGFARHLESAGFGWDDSFVEMRHDLAEIPAPGALARHITIVGWTEDLEGQAAREYKRAVAASSGSEWAAQERWSQLVENLDPTLSYLAVDKSGDRARVVGMVQVARYEQDWKSLGWSEGYVDAVAVFQADRREELLGALLAEAMRSVREAGLAKLAAGLDPRLEPGLLAYYQGAGFQEHVWWRHYTVPVEAVA